MHLILLKKKKKMKIKINYKIIMGIQKINKMPLILFKIIIKIKIVRY